MSRHLQRWAIRLGLAALVLHAVFLFVLIPKVSKRLGPSYNQNLYADGYDQLAANLRTGHGYRFYPETARTLMREPGYPVLLAALMTVSGNRFAAVKLANMIFAFGTAWLILLIANRVTPDTLLKRELVLFGAPLLYLGHPGVLFAESRGGVEILFGFLIALFLLTIYRAMDTNSWRRYAVGGAVLGVMVVVRSTPMLFPLFLALYLLLVVRRFAALSEIRNIAILVATMLVVLLPWVVRNYRLTKKFVPTASVLGVSAQAGEYINLHLFNGKPWWLLDREAARERDRVAESLNYSFEDGSNGYYQTFYNTKDELEFSHVLFQRVAADYERHPLLFLRVLGQNFFNFWFAGKTWRAVAANVMIQSPYLLFALWGGIYCFKSKKAKLAGLLLLFIGYDVAVHLPILAQARYSVPMMPLLCVLSAIGLVNAISRARETMLGSQNQGKVILQNSFASVIRLTEQAE